MYCFYLFYSSQNDKNSNTKGLGLGLLILSLGRETVECVMSKTFKMFDVGLQK